MPYFTIFQNKLPLPFEVSLKERQKLDEFLIILEESGVAEIIKEELIKSDNRGRTGYDPYRLFAAIIYGFSKHSGSLRKIEESMNFDLRFIYLMGNKTPTYVTISKFLNNVVVKRQQEIFTKITKYIMEKYGISMEDVFVDGTKLEANANKYKFVWKPTKFKRNLWLKIKKLISEYYDLPPAKESFTAKEVGEYAGKLRDEIKEKDLSLVTGKGIRSPQIVKDYKLLWKHMIKLLEYEEAEEICGPERNSYYKTDNDATAMCLKEDYYSGLGSNMHAGYNLQIAVSKGLIIDYYVSQERNDYKAFIPLLSEIGANYGEFPKRVCADAGYGSIGNYGYLAENGIENYVKYNLWEMEKSGKEAALYRYTEEGEFICLNGKKGRDITQEQRRHPRKKGNKIYRVEGCLRCKYKGYCMKALKNPSGRERIFEASPEMTKYREEARKNLLSPKGIEMRVNRSSQVEGAFGVIKEDMEYDRVRRRGLENVSGEMMLVCLGYNIRKLFKLIDGTAKMEYWHAPEDLEAEEFPEVNIEKIMAKNTKQISVNKLAKKGYKYKN